MHSSIVFCNARLDLFFCPQILKRIKEIDGKFLWKPEVHVHSSEMLIKPRMILTETHVLHHQSFQSFSQELFIATEAPKEVLVDPMRKKVWQPGGYGESGAYLLIQKRQQRFGDCFIVGVFHFPKKKTKSSPQKRENMGHLQNPTGCLFGVGELGLDVFWRASTYWARWGWSSVTNWCNESDGMGRVWEKQGLVVV